MNYEDWTEELTREEDIHGKYRKRAKDFEKRYAGTAHGSQENSKAYESEFNIFWSNVQIKQSALYSNTPAPDVRRRFKGEDRFNNVEKAQAAKILERALSFSIDQYDFDAVMNGAVNTYLVAGLGQVRVHYDAFFGPDEPERVPLEVEETEEGTKFFLDGEEVEGEQDDQGAFMRRPTERIDDQEVFSSTIPWSRFLWSVAKDYETVWWQGEVHFLTEEQVRDTFVISRNQEVPLTHTDSEKDAKEAVNKGRLARVVEIWDKRHKKHFGYIEGVDKILKFKAGDSAAADDPLRLQTFWPYPRPMFDNVIQGHWIPIPEYNYYQKQALAIDEKTRRIYNLTKEIKWRGLSAGDFKQAGDLARANDGQFLPVENMGALLEKGGLDAVFMPLDTKDLVDTVQKLYEAREQDKQEVFEITGIADIVRGATNPNETLGAQQLKGQFANMRIAKQQRTIQRFVKEIFRIKAEIIAEHFEPHVLEMMTGEQVTPEIMRLLKSDVMRAYSVDIETDSTIIADQAREQENREKAVNAITTLITAWAPIIQAVPQMAEPAQEVISFLLGAYKAGEGLEQAFEKIASGASAGSPEMAGMQTPAVGPAPGTVAQLPGNQPGVG